MDDAHELCYGLFEWIRSSNRAHLASVPAQLQLTRLGARHQFVMLSAPPERQKLFDELKAKAQHAGPIGLAHMGEVDEVTVG
jgi:hypothetical protein